MNLHLILPSEWTSDKKGDYFEEFVAGILRPMRFEVVRRIRFTGMEIDILAEAKDEPRRVFVECKAQADPVPADTISKLMGNARIQGADSSWLFSTSDLTKEGRGRWDEIKQNVALAREFTWYSPNRICDMLVDQGRALNPLSLTGLPCTKQRGEITLIVAPARWLWLVEVLERGIPSALAVLDACTGESVSVLEGGQLGHLSGRYDGLPIFTPGAKRISSGAEEEDTVAKVVAGDSWEDPRPSRPSHFVGRDDTTRQIAAFLASVREKRTPTRAFALLAPSGWGKSSLIVKLADLSRRGRLTDRCVMTAVDCRSATSSSFVAGAVQLSFNEAVSRGIVADRTYAVSSLQHPLRSPGIAGACGELEEKCGVLVIVFDQFEELFTKESLFETFTTLRELALDVDAEQLPVVLGFAWKTGVALPQDHPAYYLWHELADRRRVFELPRFGTREVRKVVRRAERALDRTLTPALRSRLVEQCQGLPWLLKKLLVHVLKRVTTPESQYLLLERELEVQILFERDLERLPETAVRCLRFVATNAPVPVTEVDDTFDTATTNLLLTNRLIVRSGMNYVVYWDIFRDYLIDGTVPSIPWARTFQRDPSGAVKALREFSVASSMTIADLSSRMHLKPGTTANVVSDLVALQLVDRQPDERYTLSRALVVPDPNKIAQHVRKQMERHVVAKALVECWLRDERHTLREWDEVFFAAQPGLEELSLKTVRQYSGKLRRWLLFAGLLDMKGSRIWLPDGVGSQMGVPGPRRAATGTFLGGSSPQRVEQLLGVLANSRGPMSRGALETPGFRNAITDAITLGLVRSLPHGEIALSLPIAAPADAKVAIQKIVRQDRVVRFLKRQLDAGVPADGAALGDCLEDFLGTDWTFTSKKRYVSGLLRFLRWAYPSIDLKKSTK